ncbi:phosphoserine phosphatase SerB [Pararhodospirillum oryzae]|uniref:Phosphoserine phosphatase n=1 Tax=Pararhodospirillum oryzae TaxID=478448 RepID=A0A512HAM2_9PROT|nr:phosphoserine phosphatase SerB [Pararhodospirillum oryzae]GEO82492.1 phosphoserine phosphatase SerB [Pararhodospirillum oryzae]
MEVVVTLVANPAQGGLTPDHLNAGRRALESLGGETSRPRWLDEGIAADLGVDGLSPDQAQAAVTQALGTAPLDVLAQPTAGRRKALLIADMDSTMVIGETLDELAAHAGLKDVIAGITARAMNGELDFIAALRERVAMLKDLPEAALAETWAHTALTPGARVAVRTLAAHGCRCLLVSGGFTYFTSRVAEACGFHDHVANRLGVAQGRLTGAVIEPIVDRSAKLATLTAEAARLGVPLSACAAIGDGANDLPMIQAAGLGIAFHAKPSVAANARLRVDHGDLTTLLYAQGFERSAFASDAA